MTDQPSEHLDRRLMLADDELLLQAARWQNAGHKLALAFVIQTWGSSPRQVGSLMLVRDDGQVAGSVSGGCVEGAVIDAALEMIEAGGSQRLDFGVADATAWEVGLSCGGQISILVVAVSKTGFAPALLDDAAKSLAQRVPVGFCLSVSFGGAPRAISVPPKSVLIDDEVWSLHTPRPHIIIVGAVHISQHLASMASQAGFVVTVIDPRRTFATADRFPGIDVVFDWPDRVLGEIGLDQETALVALTHDPKIDDAALHMVLGKPLFHIACLGSKRTHAARLQRLGDAGFSDADIGRIKGPAGLDIGAKTPAEIAISVLAELVAAFRGKPV